MDDPLNNFLQAENRLFNNDNNDIPNELNTLFNENNIEPFAIFGFNNNNNNLLNDNMEGPTGYTLHIHPQEPIVNEHEFQNRERRQERGLILIFFSFQKLLQLRQLILMDFAFLNKILIILECFLGLF